MGRNRFHPKKEAGIMNFQELMKKRQSCRSYKDMPVEREKLMACMEAARISPSACNSQPWSFVLVDDPAIAKKMPMTMLNGLVPINRFTKDCNAYIVVIEEQANLSARLGGRYLDQEFAPIDLGLATQSICLAATEQGLGSCIMGCFDETKMKEILGIPFSKRIRLVIAIGYPTDTDPLREKVRKPMEAILHINKW
jgi:nitroreductase